LALYQTGPLIERILFEAAENIPGIVGILFGPAGDNLCVEGGSKRQFC
jgi:hypothetical protein